MYQISTSAEIVQVVVGIVSALFFPSVVLVCWLWWMENCQPYYEQTRFVLFVIVTLLTIYETYLIWAGVMCEWMYLPLLICNLWGYMDAVYRFPLVHEAFSRFHLKMLSVLLLKIAFIPACLPNIGRNIHNALTLLALILWNLIALPGLYIAALPVDSSDQEMREAAHDVVDVDPVARALQFVTDKEFRKEKWEASARQLRSTAIILVDNSDTAQRIFEGLSPKRMQSLSPKNRRV